jgi:hypothetical protein
MIAREPESPNPPPVVVVDWEDDELAFRDDRNEAARRVVEVVRLLEKAAITCCLTGATALRYFGVARVDQVRFNPAAIQAGTEFIIMTTGMGTQCGCPSVGTGHGGALVHPFLRTL